MTKLYRPTDAPALGTVRGQEDAARVLAHYADGWTYWVVLEYDPATDTAWAMTNDGEPECERFCLINLGTLERMPSVWDKDDSDGMTLDQFRESIPNVNIGDYY